MFDSDEYFHLALHAGALGQHHACMTYLKELLQQEPKNAEAIYLLAVQHAELGLIERAVRGMKAALAIDPTIEMARFQLGLLQLDRNRRAEARANFVALSGSSDPSLRTICEAMIALADGHSTLAHQLLARRLSQEPADSSWASLIRRMLDGPLPGEPVKARKPDGNDSEAVLDECRTTTS